MNDTGRGLRELGDDGRPWVLPDIREVRYVKFDERIASGLDGIIDE